MYSSACIQRCSDDLHNNYTHTTITKFDELKGLHGFLLNISKFVVLYESKNVMHYDDSIEMDFIHGMKQGYMYNKLIQYIEYQLTQ